MAGFSEETTIILRDTFMLLQELVAPICRKHGLTLQQFYVLAELSSNPHQIATQVADRVGIQRTNFAAVRHKLEAMGLLSHERGKIDKRKVFLDLTENGHTVYEDVIRDIGEYIERNASVMDESDFTAIARGAESLHKLVSRAFS